VREALIVTHNLSKTYRTGKVEVPALQSVSITVHRGEFVAVMGPSGSGKSTFLNLLGCLDHPSSGSYILNGTDVSTMTDDELAAVRSREIGFVFQGFNLLARTNAQQTVELPLIYRGESSQEKLSLALLKAVGLPDRGRHRPNELSGGEQQRVAIARALINSPSLILADEPTGNLDSRTSGEIMDIFRDLNRSGITVVMVTHEEDIASYARRRIRFLDGRVISDEIVASGLRADVSAGNPSDAQLHPAQGNGKRRSIFSPGELWENLRSAARSLWQNRTRAFLTTLGILIGVGAVIAMVSIGQGAAVQVQQRIEGLGSNLLSVIPGSSSQGGVRQGFGSVTTLTADDAAAIRQSIPGLAGVAPEASSRQQLKYRKNTWSTNVVGTTADYPLVRNWPVEEGSFFSDEDYRARRTVAVLGSDVVTNLFSDEAPLGKTIKIGDTSFKVIGVLQAKGGGGFFSQDDTVLIPLSTQFIRFRRQNDLRSIGVAVTDKKQMEQVREEISALIRARHHLAPGSEDDFTVVSQEDILQTVQGVSQTMTLLLASIAGISLLVGGIGIMNIMLVSVTERTREIGIRKAIGARRRDILAQFLTEAIILSGSGGLLGWILGWAAANIISKAGQLTISITPATVGLALGFSVAVGVFFGIYPARKASRMDPIQALRFE
jgi:macrolide transport system ATP-binding/permease protein